MGKIKENKKIIILCVAIIVIIVALIVFVGFYKKNVNVKIVDSLGDEIENLEENKMPFTIEKEDKNQKITVNGEEYQEGKRIYNVGEYEIKISNGLKSQKKVVKINEIERNTESEYNIYVMTETLQTLFANLKIAEDSEQKGFFWTARTSTVKMENLANNFKNLTLSQYNGELEGDDFQKQLIPEIKEYVKEVIQKDPDAYFHLYTQEAGFYLELELFGKIGLDDSRYDVTIYSNGTLSYVVQYEITKEDKYERFLEEKNDYNEILEKIRNNTLEYNDHPGSYLVDDKSEVFKGQYNYDYMLISTLRENVRYLLQYPEMLEFKDEKIKEEMENANIEKIVAQDEYNKLNDSQKSIFFEDIGFNKEELDKEYFQDENGKYLVITGTIPFYGEHYKKEEFENIIRQVYNDYSNEYIILYKPHPNALPNEEQRAFLEGLGIKILPGQLPMEAIMFIYPNLKIGGFASSLYMSVDEGKAEFFFARNSSELVEPLNELYDKLFSNAKFYN